MQTPSREVLDDQPGDVAVVSKGCCPAHDWARNREDRRRADRTCPRSRAARRSR